MMLLAMALSQGVEGVVFQEASGPVEGAYVYAYEAEHPELQRPPDYASGPTGQDGSFRLHLPEGRYILRAVKRASGRRLGPLEVHDLVSETVMVKVQRGVFTRKAFTLKELREALRAPEEQEEKLAVIKGRVRSGEGYVQGAYVVAYEGGRRQGLPEFISGLTDAQGRYELYVPLGATLAIGATTSPFDRLEVMGWHAGTVLVEDTVLSGVDIVIEGKR
jgi:hypothetical protein